MEFQPQIHRGLRELALFAGAGGGILGGLLLGWQTICAVEIDKYATSILLQRQNDGILPPFPVWDDMRTFDGKPWQGIVDVISGGFPCQDISAAGKGAGIEGEQSGLWREMARIIGEVRPGYVIVENSPMLIRRGLTRVISDFASMGYDAQWACISASDLGAPHQRNRIWIVANASSRRCNKSSNREMEQSGRTEIVSPSHDMANSNGMRELQSSWIEQNKRNGIGISSEKMANTSCFNEQRIIASGINQEKWCQQGKQQIRSCSDEIGWWTIEPDLDRVVNGLAHRVDRLKAIGNGQVPIVAASAFKILC